MNRSSFLKNILGLVFGSNLINKTTLLSFEKKVIYTGFIRGFAYYQGEKIIHKLKEGATLILRCEHQNPFDTHAISINFLDHKIGYFPAEDNVFFHRLLNLNPDQFHTNISKVNPSLPPWEKVEFTVFSFQQSSNQTL
ncbi:MAG: HIRAN domain-containing protein [Saprospiraceae bacterium]